MKKYFLFLFVLVMVLLSSLMFGQNSSSGSLENVKFSMSKVASVDKQIEILADSIAPDKTGMRDIGSASTAIE